MNDALALHLNQTGKLNIDDETIHILYQKHTFDSSSGVRAYAFLHALLKKAKRQLNNKIPTPSDIEKETSIGSFCANLKGYYFQLQMMGVSLADKTKSRFSLSALQQKALKWTGSWIDWITSQMTIPFLRNSLSRSSYCASNTFAPSIFPPLQ
jgi:hypothetical protein